MNSPCESITKNIFNISQHLALKLKIILGIKNYKGCRKKFLNEYEYNTTKYNDTNKLTSVTSNTIEYLILETQLTWEEKQKLDNYQEYKSMRMMLSYENIFNFYQLVDTAYKWLAYPEKIYEFSNTGNYTNIVKIKPEFANICVVCNSTIGSGLENTYGVLKAVPTIADNPDGSRELKILLYFGSDRGDIFVDSLNISQISAIRYFLIHFDLCEASIALTNQVMLTSRIFQHQ